MSGPVPLRASGSPGSPVPTRSQAPPLSPTRAGWPEPYRVLFSIGLTWGVIGAGLWPLHALGASGALWVGGRIAWALGALPRIARVRPPAGAPARAVENAAGS